MTLEEFKALAAQHVYLADDGKISHDWVVGGMGGGNCWGDNPDYAITAEDEPADHPIDDILLVVAPNISFLQYRRISGAMSTRDFKRYEYYGNYTEYRERYITVETLYNKLVEMNLI